MGHQGNVGSQGAPEDFNGNCTVNSAVPPQHHTTRGLTPGETLNNQWLTDTAVGTRLLSAYYLLRFLAGPSQQSQPYNHLTDLGFFLAKIWAEAGSGAKFAVFACARESKRAHSSNNISVEVASH